MSSTYREELDRYLSDLFVKADCVIDIGGSQLPIKDRVRYWSVADYYIGDLENPHVDSPKPDFVCDLNSRLVQQANAIAGYMGMGDMVFCLEVFDYVYDPVNAFQILYKLTKKGGKCIASFPFMYPTHNPIEDDCLRYTEFAIKKLADRVGFKIDKITPRRPESNALDMLWRNERMRAAKGYDHNVTGWIVEMSK